MVLMISNILFDVLQTDLCILWDRVCKQTETRTLDPIQYHPTRCGGTASWLQKQADHYQNCNTMKDIFHLTSTQRNHFHCLQRTAKYVRRASPRMRKIWVRCMMGTYLVVKTGTNSSTNKGKATCVRFACPPDYHINRWDILTEYVASKRYLQFDGHE